MTSFDYDRVLMGAQITANTRAGTAALVVDISFLYVETDF